MPSSRPSALSLTLAALGIVLLSGCTKPRQADAQRSLHQEHGRLSSELRIAQERYEALQHQHDLLRRDLAAARAQLAEAQAQQRQPERPAAARQAHTAHRFSADVSFARGSADLSEAGRAEVAQLVARLRRDAPGKTIRVIGHSDSSPVRRRASIERYGDNWGLSARRAASVVSALIAAGWDADRIVGCFYGPQRPIADNSSSDGKAQNRRVDVVLE